jgi:site-specific DNA recombinase
MGQVSGASNQPKSKRTGISYVRVSTDDQAKNGVSLENQTERIRQYAEYQQIIIVREIRDEGISGGVNRSRMGFIELLDRVEAGGIDVIVLYSLERLSRDMLTLLALERLMSEYDVELHTAEGAVNTSDPACWLSFAMKCLLAEHERRQVKYRTKRAMQHKKRKGEAFNHTPYGYQRNANLLVPDLTEQDVIKSINSMYQAGKRLVEIVDYLNRQGVTTKKGKEWTPQQVKRLVAGYKETFRKGQTRLKIATRAFIEAIA